MAVVINEMDVTPQAAPGGQAGAADSGSANSSAAGSSPSDTLKQMEKTQHRKHARLHRLEAY